MHIGAPVDALTKSEVSNAESRSVAVASDHPLREPLSTQLKRQVESWEWLRHLGNAVEPVGKAMPLIVTAFISWAVGSGEFGGAAKLLQGYNIKQVASIDEPVFFTHQRFKNFLFHSDYKTFPTDLTDPNHLPSDLSVVGDVSIWHFSVQGYAAGPYFAYFEEQVGEKIVSDSCSFRVETTEDADNVCAFFAAQGESKARSMLKNKEPGSITVWLNAGSMDGAHHPIAVKNVSLPKE